MTDYFALLKQARRPWLDPELLNKEFLAVSAEVHPDRVHGAADAEKREALDRYIQLNAAYNCLREPKDRLRHLLELERSGPQSREAQNVPGEWMGLFAEVSATCREADSIIAETVKVISPLLKVQMFERQQGQIEKLITLQKQVNEWREEAILKVKTLDSGWLTSQGNAQRSHMLQELEELWRLLSYVGKWANQIQERIVQLTI